MQSSLPCVCVCKQSRTHACPFTQCTSKTQQSPPSTSLSLSLSLSLCVSRPLSRSDMQEFEHELYIATQQPSSGPCSQTNNGQHDNSIMKWATWPPPSRGAVTLDICISMMPGLMVAPLGAADIKKWIDYFSQKTRSSERRRVCVAVNLDSDPERKWNKAHFIPQLFPPVSPHWFMQLWFITWRMRTVFAEGEYCWWVVAKFFFFFLWSLPSF